MAESVLSGETDAPETVQEESLEDLDDVDAIIERANKLIETVNRDRTARNSSFLNSTLRSPIKDSPQSSPVMISPSPERITMMEENPSPVESPINTNMNNVTVDVDFDEIDNAIDNIHRFCDSFSENSRPELHPEGGAIRRVRQELVDLASDGAEEPCTHDFSERTRPRGPLFGSTTQNNNATVQPVEIIDLSNTQSFSAVPTPYHATSNNAYTDDDDECIIVYSNLNDVVDLCTPGRPTTAISHFPFRLNDNNSNPNNANNTAAATKAVVHTSAVVTSVKSTKSSAATTTKSSAKKPPESTHHRSRSPIASTNRSQSPTKPHLKCPVCMDSAVDKKPTSTKCGHVFCESCIKQAIRMTHKCPMCNTKLNPRMLFRIYL